MLSIKGLYACYDESMILRNVNLEVGKGKIVCLIGRNGVGKSTLLKSIMGIVKTPQGKITLENQDMTSVPTYYRARAGIGYVPQGREIFPQMTVKENLELGLEVVQEHGSIDPMIYELFPVLQSMLYRKGGDLSGGQQQQLAIARALVGKPKLLILDEPTEGIQPSIIKEIGISIKKLKEMGYTIFIVEQYLEFVLDISDVYYVMDKGEIVESGNTADIDIDDIKSRIAI